MDSGEKKSLPRIPALDALDVARFLQKIAFAETEQCWNWLASTDRKYGTFGLYGRQYKAHRVSFRLFFGRQPDPTKDICHSCDNTLCVNPYHLFEGTRSENLLDMVRKNRRVFWKPKGDASPDVKLSDTQVAEIRERYVPRKVSTRYLAKEYGVARSLIHRIISGQSRVKDETCSIRQDAS